MSKRYLCSAPRFIEALFKVAVIQNQTRHPSMDEGIKKYHTYLMECYSSIKKNEILLFTETWIELEDIARAQKDKYCMFLCICRS